MPGDQGGIPGWELTHVKVPLQEMVVLWSVAEDSLKMVPAGWSKTEKEYKDGTHQNKTKNPYNTASARFTRAESMKTVPQPPSQEGIAVGPSLHPERVLQWAADLKASA